MENFEVGKVYRYTGTSVGGHKNQLFLITAIKPLGDGEPRLCGRRYIKKTNRFSGTSYYLARVSDATNWTEEAMPEGAAR